MSVSSSPALDGSAAVGRGALMAGTAAACIGAFLFRYLTVEFTDDHFVHLSRALQIVQGDVPVRDFFDPGALLQYYASAAALLWSGHNLFGEALLTTGFIAAGAGLTFAAAARLSGSFWISMAAAFIGVLSMPRLYNYPKAFFYVLAIAGAWSYARRPGKARLVALAIITTVAFLFRHDHGLYIGIAVVAMLLTRHWGDRQQSIHTLAQYVVAILVLVTPFLAFIASTRGLQQYIADLAPQAQSLSQVRAGLMPMSIDPAEPLARIAPPSGPRINVRWADNLSDEARRALEQSRGLVSPVHTDGSTWSYVPLHIERADIRTLINDPAVLDTHGINRPAQQLDREIPFYLALERRYSILRLRLAPGVFSRGNARAWFYDLTVLTPIIASLVVAWLLWRNQIDRSKASVIVMASLLGLIIVQTILRGAAESRLPDVTNPISVVGAWLIALCIRPHAVSGALQRFARTTGALVLGIVTVWSVGTEADAGATLVSSQVLDRPAGAWTQLSTVTMRLRNRPLDNFDSIASGIPAAARYVRECTAPTDRVLVTWFAPQLVFYAERGFAGGQVYLLPGWYSSPADQQLTIDRMARQRVPVVLEDNDADYRVYFSDVYDYVHQHYTEVEPTSDGIAGVRVFVDRRLMPAGTYEPRGLPCFR
jgi:hypothetical protein